LHALQQQSVFGASERRHFFAGFRAGAACFNTFIHISDALATAAQARQVSLCKFELLMRNFALVAQISVQSSISR
jgi:hypothetical protein